jgi:hypothetical protein
MPKTIPDRIIRLCASSQLASWPSSEDMHRNQAKQSLTLR